MAAPAAIPAFRSTVTSTTSRTDPVAAGISTIRPAVVGREEAACAMAGSTFCWKSERCRAAVTVKGVAARTVGGRGTT